MGGMVEVFVLSDNSIIIKSDINLKTKTDSRFRNTTMYIHLLHEEDTVGCGCKVDDLQWRVDLIKAHTYAYTLCPAPML